MCPISSRAWCAGMDYLQLMIIAPSSASDADDMTSLIILAIVNTDPLLVDNSVLFDMKKFPLIYFWIFFREVRGVAVARY